MGKGRDRRKRAAKRKRQAPAPILEPPRDDSPGTGDPDAFVPALLQPKPHVGAGAIALPEPDDPEELGWPAALARLILAESWKPT